MKTPPSKTENLVQYLKTHHQQQIEKLLQKNQLEIDIVEDIRNFVKQKCNLEKNYAEGLLKLSTNFQNKKIPSVPNVDRTNHTPENISNPVANRRISLTGDSGLSPDSETRGNLLDWSKPTKSENVYQIWRILLNEQEKIARAHLAACQVMQEDLIKDSKNYKQSKCQNVKKHTDALIIVQKDLQNCVKDFNKIRSEYKNEGDEKTNNKILKKNRKRIKPNASTTNAFLLSMLAANTHQDRYFLTDLQDSMRHLEMGVYQRISLELSEMSDRDYNAACLATHFPVLGEKIQYSGPPEAETNMEDGAETGDISISTQDDEGHVLKKECRKWAIRVARETKAINDMERRLSALKKCSSRAILTRDVSREDVEARVEELEHILRRTRTSKMKEETKLSYLRRELGPEVEKWLADLPLPPGEAGTKMVNIEDINRRISVANIIKSNNLEREVDAAPSNNTLDLTEPTATGLSTTMPVSMYSEMTCNSDSEDSNYDFEDCASESDSLLGNNKARSAPNITSTTAPALSTAKIPRSSQNFQLKMLDETLSIGLNQISPTSETATEQFEDARSLQSPGSFFSTSPPEGGASPARFHPVVASPERHLLVQAPSLSQTPANSALEASSTNKCIALYNFAAENHDELNMVYHEEVELLGDGDDEGWARVKNYKGEIGFVPKSYLELIMRKEGRQFQNTTANNFMGAPLVQHGLSFSSVDYIAPSSEYHPLESIPEGVTVHFRDPIQNSAPRKNHIKFCKALYDFDGKTGSELSFKAGDIIKVVRTKTPRGGDDGWWEGELCGRAGLFPSLVVEPFTDKPRPGYNSPQSQRRSEPQKLEIVEFDHISEPGLSKPLSPMRSTQQFLGNSSPKSPVSGRKRFLHPEELFIKNDIFAVKDQKGNFNIPPEDLELGSTTQRDDFPLLKPPPPYSLVVTPATPRTPTSPLPSDLQNNNPAGLIPTPSIQQEQSQDDSKQNHPSSRGGFEEKANSDLIECTSLNIEMTDKNFETADFTSSEKQVRFSMTTMKTPPNSPKPPNTRHSDKMDSRSKASENKEILPLANTNTTRRSFLSQPQMEQMYPEISKTIQENMEAFENIKVNFLEKLEVLPESKA